MCTLTRRSQKDRRGGDRSTSSRTSGYQSHVSFTRGPTSASPSTSKGRQTSKVGAGCGNGARPVLRGGYSVMGIPTAIGNRSLENRTLSPDRNGEIIGGQRNFNHATKPRCMIVEGGQVVLLKA